MFANEYIALQIAKSRQNELESERRHDLLNFLVREYKAELRRRGERDEYSDRDDRQQPKK